MTCVRHTIVHIVLFIIVASLSASNARADVVRIGAGAAPTENVLKKVKSAFESSSGTTLTIVDVGPVEALQQLNDGKVDAAAGGVSFADWMAMMSKSGVTVDPQAYKHRVIGKDIIRVIAHKSVGVKALTREQLKGIFTGKVANWKEVGGNDLPIVVVTGTKIPGTQSVFQKQVLDGESYISSSVQVGTAPEVKEKVAATAGGIGLSPKSGVDETIAAIETPEVGRPITLITRGAPSGTVQKLLEFIAGDGKSLIEK
jgi:phosphate transport system substrate-binding protein